MPAQVGQFGIVATRQPRSAKIIFAEVQESQRRELQPVANAHARSRARVAANWTNRPEFEGRVRVSQTEVSVQVVIRNRSARIKGGKATIGDLWKWLDRTGTRPHKIIARNPKGLAFLYGTYQSKTGANPARYGGPGKVVGGTFVRPRQVDHPGFPPRRFSQVINKDLDGEFKNAVKRGYRKGFRR